MMKKILSQLWLLLPFALAAQNNASIHCSFTSATGDSVALIPAQYFIDGYEPTYSVVIKNNACDFSFAVSKPTVTQLKFNHQTMSIYVEPGDALQLNISNDSLYKAVSFSGKGAPHNQFLKSFNEHFRSDFDKHVINNAILTYDVDAFEMGLYDELKKQLDYFNSYADKNLFSDSFKKYVENTIRYHYFATLLSYPIVRANQSTQILTVKAFPAVMLDGIDTKLMNDDALNNQSYRDFLYYYVVYFTSEANGFNKFTDLSTSMEMKVALAQKVLTPQSLVWYIAWFLNNDVEKVSQYTAKHIYEVLNSTETNGTYTKLLKSKVEKRMSVSDVTADVKTDNNGTPPSKTSSTQSSFPVLKDIDENTFTFDDLKGKAVYVDYWASWCGPCRAEMPYSKQLHTMFDEKQLKQLVFLYISIDADENSWKQAVKDIGMEGKLAISPGNWNSEIVKYFQINSIPRYMLIDKKGNIVNLNAPRPSSGQEIYNEILKLLE